MWNKLNYRRKTQQYIYHNLAHFKKGGKKSNTTLRDKLRERKLNNTASNAKATTQHNAMLLNQ